MKITNIETKEIVIPLKNRFEPFGCQVQKDVAMALVKVSTDEGITGWGGGPGGALNINKLVKPFLIGEDPFAIERHANVLRDANTLGEWPWIVEIALWDIIGKATGQPIYKLLGGYQDKIMAYASTMECRDPKRRAEDAIRLYEEGFRALKIRLRAPKPTDDLKIIAAIRNAVGDKMEILTDANQALWSDFSNLHNSKYPQPHLRVKWDYKTALTMARELEKMDVYWLEEPLQRYDRDNLRRLCEEVNLPIAGGEFNTGLHEFRWLIENNCYDILTPDVTSSEGLSQVKKIAALCEITHKSFSVHTWSNGLGVLANLHLAAAVPNCSIFELPYDPPAFNIIDDAFQAILTEPITVDKEGFIHLPQKPGLGIDINEEVVEKYSV
jgi:L-alanine-DL-glutamate epimerase-like enolase superfamily enzyme